MSNSKVQKIVQYLLKENPEQQTNPQDKKNIVDTKPELQKYLKDLSVKVSGLEGSDAREIQFVSTILKGMIEDIGKGSLGPILQQVLKYYDDRTKKLG